MMASVALFLLLPICSVGSAKGDCHGQACAAPGSASMLQTHTRDLQEGRSLAAMNSSYSSALFVRTKNDQDFFNQITANNAELKELIDAFLQSDFMTKLCSETPITGGNSWDCDPSQLSASDLEELLGRLNNTVIGQEALAAWIEIVALVQKPMEWIQEIMNAWLPRLQEIVTETLGKLQQANVEDFFNAQGFDLDSFSELFKKQDGKYGLTRFFEASVYVAEDLIASQALSEMLDDFAELFTKLQTAIMALQGKPFDFLKEQTILDALTNVKTEIDAWFDDIKRDFLNFTEARDFLDDPANKAVWEGKDIATIAQICLPLVGDPFGAACQTLQAAAVHAGKISLGWQTIAILNNVASSRLLQVSEQPSVDKHMQKKAIAAAPHTDAAMSVEATKMQTQMNEVDAEIKAKAPDAAFGSSASLRTSSSSR